MRENDTKVAIFKTYQIVWYFLGIINSALLLRFLFKMMAANRVGVVNALYAITDPLALPFYGIFGVSRAGESVFEWTTLVAIGFFSLLAYAIVRFLAIMKPSSPEEAEREI